MKKEEGSIWQAISRERGKIFAAKVERETVGVVVLLE
jgi:hypothetical protein